MLFILGSRNLLNLLQTDCLMNWRSMSSWSPWFVLPSRNYCNKVQDAAAVCSLLETPLPDWIFCAALVLL